MRWILVLVGSFMFGFGSLAHASDYGCKVLLCLANPNGARAEAECHPPIDQLYIDLNLGRPFPECEMAESSAGKSYAKQGFSYYDPCPDGTTALSAGSFAALSLAKPTTTTPVVKGIGTGDNLSPGSGENTSRLTQKVCVGKLVGRTTATIGETRDDSQTVDVGLYDSVRLLDVQGSPRIIDVFINDALYRRVRW
jgi:hypothetical protein